MTAEIIPFPVNPRAINYDAMAPAAPAYAPDGIPARVGDIVSFRSGPFKGHCGAIYSVGGALGVFRTRQTYSVLCTDGTQRLAYADDIEVVQ